MKIFWEALMALGCFGYIFIFIWLVERPTAEDIRRQLRAEGWVKISAMCEKPSAIECKAIDCGKSPSFVFKLNPDGDL